MGTKQRDVIRMTEQEVEEFLRGRHTMSLATINHDATVHLVAMWYGFLEGCMAIETKTKSQKVRNLRRDPRMTCMVEEGDSYEELRGVELVGTGEIVEAPERMWEMGVDLFERYQGTYTEEMRPFVEAMLHTTRRTIGIRRPGCSCARRDRLDNAWDPGSHVQRGTPDRRR